MGLAGLLVGIGLLLVNCGCRPGVKLDGRKELDQDMEVLVIITVHKRRYTLAVLLFGGEWPLASVVRPMLRQQNRDSE